MQNARMHNPEAAARRARDWTAHFAGRLTWWIIPALILASGSLFKLSLAQMGFILAGTFAWMGTGCVLNARRCGRLHCYFSGPALWLGAIGGLLIGLRILSGSHDLNYVIFGAVALFVASYLPEAIWGKYVRSGPSELEPDADRR